MRRVLSLLVLLCFAVTQAAAAACPMADGPGAAGDGARAHHPATGADRPSAPHAAHGGHDRHDTRPAADADADVDVDAPTHDHGAHPDPAADGCGIVMPCGVFAAPAADAPGLPLGAGPAEPSAAPPSHPLSPDPASEPPPPRLADPDPA